MDPKVEIKQGIMYAVLDEEVLSLDTAINFVEKRLQMTKGKDTPLVCDISLVKKASKEVRDFFGGEDGHRGIEIAGIVASSSFSRIMGNFFLKIKKPPVPIKLFSSISEAEVWIKANSNELAIKKWTKS